MWEAIVSHPIASITALATLIYASILFWDRWTDKPDLNIEDLSLEKLDSNKCHISVKITNDGRKTAHDVIGNLKVFDEDGKQIELNHPEHMVSKKELSLIWVPSLLAAKNRPPTSKEVKQPKEVTAYPEETKSDIPRGGHNFLRLGRPATGLRNVFSNLEEGETYQFEVTVKTSKSEDEITKEGVYPADFRERSQL